jgi:hypothetical protein
MKIKLLRRPESDSRPRHKGGAGGTPPGCRQTLFELMGCWDGVANFTQRWADGRKRWKSGGKSATDAAKILSAEGARREFQAERRFLGCNCG